MVYNKLLRRRTAHGLGDQQHLENNQLCVRKCLCRGDAHRMNLHPEDVFLLLIDLSQNTIGLYGLMSVGCSYLFQVVGIAFAQVGNTQVGNAHVSS